MCDYGENWKDVWLPFKTLSSLTEHLSGLAEVTGHILRQKLSQNIYYLTSVDKDVALEEQKLWWKYYDSKSWPNVKRGHWFISSPHYWGRPFQARAKAWSCWPDFSVSLKIIRSQFVRWQVVWRHDQYATDRQIERQTDRPCWVSVGLLIWGQARVFQSPSSQLTVSPSVPKTLPNYKPQSPPGKRKFLQSNTTKQVNSSAGKIWTPNQQTKEWAKIMVYNLCDNIINVSSYTPVSRPIISPRNSKSTPFMEQNDLQD